MAKKMTDGCWYIKEALHIARFGSKEEKSILPNLWSQALEELKSCKKYKKRYVDDILSLEQLAEKSPMRQFIFTETIRITKNVPQLAKRIFRLRRQIYSNPELQEYCERIQNIADNLRDIIR